MQWITRNFCTAVDEPDSSVFTIGEGKGHSFQKLFCIPGKYILFIVSVTYVKISFGERNELITI